MCYRKWHEDNLFIGETQEELDSCIKKYELQKKRVAGMKTYADYLKWSQGK